MVSAEVRAIADRRLADLGLRVSFGRHVDERNAFGSSPVASRVSDLHEAFADEAVDAVVSVLGGFNSNQLLDHLDWNLIGDHPKVFCGYSDITALQNAMLARTGLVTYSGPHYASFGMRDHFEHTLEWFRACVFTEQPIEVRPAPSWSNDAWFIDQDERHLEPNGGWWIIQSGEATGRLVGGNLCTLNLLQGTPFMPRLGQAVAFVEDDSESRPHHFDRDLQSLLHQPGGDQLQALLIGRFEKASGMTRGLLEQIIAGKPQLDGVPVIANLDFGHTDPFLTVPIGGTMNIACNGDAAEMTITEH